MASSLERRVDYWYAAQMLEGARIASVTEPLRQLWRNKLVRYASIVGAIFTFVGMVVDSATYLAWISNNSGWLLGLSRQPAFRWALALTIVAMLIIGIWQVRRAQAVAQREETEIRQRALDDLESRIDEIQVEAVHNSLNTLKDQIDAVQGEAVKDALTALAAQFEERIKPALHAITYQEKRKHLERLEALHEKLEKWGRSIESNFEKEIRVNLDDPFVFRKIRESMGPLATVCGVEAPTFPHERLPKPEKMIGLYFRPKENEPYLSASRENLHVLRAFLEATNRKLVELAKDLARIAP